MKKPGPVKGPYPYPSLKRTGRCHQCWNEMVAGDSFWGWSDHVYCSEDCAKRDEDPEYGHN